ncbi:LysR family transcriptional regulator [Ihubacter sp. rT4E-8]|uniref:LysR family transcriptional regulator n=1 Tax=Ihubacter sp. rT4E-8 TaxID=3242369 RepID=UPI003CF2F03A
MDIRDLQYFLKLAEEKSFTKSAEAFYISQSALSQKISKLEKELGLKLFSRSNRTVTLTDAGFAFFSHAEEVMHAWERLHTAMRTYKDDMPANISVGLFMQSGYTQIPSLIMDFLSVHHDFQVNISTAGETQLLSGLQDGTYHFAFLRCEKSDIPPSLCKIPLLEEELGVLVHKDDPLADKQSVERADIVNYHLICEKFGLTNSYESLKAGFAARNLTLPTPFAYTDNVQMQALLISSAGYVSFTTRESGLKMQEKFAHLRYLPQQTYQPITLYLLYPENNQKLAGHPFCTYIKKCFPKVRP